MNRDMDFLEEIVEGRSAMEPAFSAMVAAAYERRLLRRAQSAPGATGETVGRADRSTAPLRAADEPPDGRSA